MSVNLLEVPLLGVGMVLPLERDAWSMASGKQQMSAIPLPPLLPRAVLFVLYLRLEISDCA